MSCEAASRKVVELLERQLGSTRSEVRDFSRCVFVWGPQGTRLLTAVHRLEQQAAAGAGADEERTNLVEDHAASQCALNADDGDTLLTIRTARASRIVDDQRQVARISLFFEYREDSFSHETRWAGGSFFLVCYQGNDPTTFKQAHENVIALAEWNYRVANGTLAYARSIQTDSLAVALLVNTSDHEEHSIAHQQLVSEARKRNFVYIRVNLSTLQHTNFLCTRIMRLALRVSIDKDNTPVSPAGQIYKESPAREPDPYFSFENESGCTGILLAPLWRRLFPGDPHHRLSPCDLQRRDPALTVGRSPLLLAEAAAGGDDGY